MVLALLGRQSGFEPLLVGVFIPNEAVRRVVSSIFDSLNTCCEFSTNPNRIRQWLTSERHALVVAELDSSRQTADAYLDLYMKIHGSGCEPVLVALSGSSEGCSRAMQAGAIYALKIPIDPDEAVSQLGLALRTALLLDHFRKDRQRLEREVHRSTQLLNQTRLEVTRRLGRAAEFRDNETGRHVIRVSKTAEMVARSIGLDASEVELIFHASPLHDIGKIGIPDSVLKKPGPLTDSEWETMKRHPVIGEQILAGSDDPLIAKARVIALTHHERWDGNGYPRGLEGSAIPLEGRVVAICDVFDALTSARPYKEPWPFADAFEYVANQAGRQFDPDIAGQFVALREEIQEVARYYAEPEQHEPAWSGESLDDLAFKD